MLTWFIILSISAVLVRDMSNWQPIDDDREAPWTPIKERRLLSAVLPHNELKAGISRSSSKSPMSILPKFFGETSSLPIYIWIHHRDWFVYKYRSIRNEMLIEFTLVWSRFSIASRIPLSWNIMLLRACWLTKRTVKERPVLFDHCDMVDIWPGVFARCCTFLNEPLLVDISADFNSRSVKQYKCW